ncbi:hypothetical protein QBC33DRAFT_52669 [Phialemonium atrogriseum]|uniref:Uncharacterized protein n=1 Tax=Phialemonium atrogriseum TaxID=1093897 RepID=A0AAJ0FMC0_9PEZI|nr:uncharacterized protein QBC33DRAFT_52669 [Phialemonium atrogriseum]KAK1767669.1 hypothetical protein QBC33DRAFT_52669 [Phialemonium atrogriseum]
MQLIANPKLRFYKYFYDIRTGVPFIPCSCWRLTISPISIVQLLALRAPPVLPPPVNRSRLQRRRSILLPPLPAGARQHGRQFDTTARKVPFVATSRLFVPSMVKTARPTRRNLPFPAVVVCMYLVPSLFIPLVHTVFPDYHRPLLPRLLGTLLLPLCWSRLPTRPNCPAPVVWYSPPLPHCSSRSFLHLPLFSFLLTRRLPTCIYPTLV